jgi:16S rRNA (cytidine1402-2'-O)-methyltransferase
MTARSLFIALPRGNPLTDPLALAANQHYPAPALYVVATPIGNVADITVRALHLLALADRIAAEDTRNTAQLLARYDIAKPLVAAHEHNEREAAQHVIDCLRAGERVAYVSDAGTPAISDPGARLVDAVRDAGFPVVPLPGASALTTALSAAGDWVGTFTFVGFLPTKAKQRAAHLHTLAAREEALVFYEAPHRIVETVQALAETLGGSRRVLIAREITKLHESLHRCTLAEGPAWLAGDPNRQRGEFVLVVEGAPAPQPGAGDQHDAVLNVLLEEVPVSTAVKLAVALTGASRSVLYARALELKKS